MTASLDEMSIWRATSLCLVPLGYLLSALLASRLPAAFRWRAADGLTLISLLASLLALGALMYGGAAYWQGIELLALNGHAPLRTSLNHDLLSATMLALVGVLGWVIVRYSRSYLATEPGTERYLRNLPLVLASVSVLILSNNLFVMALAWTSTSLALHGLLTFYPDRRPALIAAHKKFLVSRFAELLLISGFVILAAHYSTAEVDEILSRASGEPASGLVASATLLIALSALLKSAQLPFHGWLMQVMEAPTPVSALLHAGVINLGGFVLLRFAPLVSESTAASTLLIAVGGTTAAAAAAVAMSRHSVKLALAWSTCAQMGFMLLQCGLGLYALAWLHMLGHAVYKASKFLGAGERVRQHVRFAQAGPLAPLRRPEWALATLAGVATVGVGFYAWRLDPLQHTALCLPGLVLALGTAGNIVAGLQARMPAIVVRVGVASVAFAIAYLGLHELLGTVFGTFAGPSASALWAALWVAVLFVGLHCLHLVANVRHGRAVPARLRALLEAGFYLDEYLSRLAFRLWPLPAAARPSSVPLSTRQETLG